MDLGEVNGSPAPFMHDPGTILMVTRMGAMYTALSLRRYPTRYTSRPGWMQEIIDQEHLGQRNTQEREARTGRYHPYLAALAATRNREDQVQRPEEHAAADDDEHAADDDDEQAR